MARINLLPWRAERRAQRQRDFYAMLGLSALAGAVLSFLLWFHYDSQISGQMVRNNYLQGEIDKVQSQISEIDTLGKQKSRLLARKQVIEELQANRSQMVHLFDSLVRTIPDGVSLSSIKQEGEILKLEGHAQSNARVSAYMRNLESSGWMTKPELAIIQVTADTAQGTPAPASTLPYMFRLQVQLANPNAKKDEPSAPASAVPATPGATLPAAAQPAATDAPAPAPATPAATTGSQS